ncbi:MAG TPA: CTB family bacteriocin [Trichocoleus sp.]
MNEMNSEAIMAQAEASALAASAAEMTELTEDALDAVSGGSMDFSSLDGLFKSAGSVFSQSGISLGQASFAGPNGAGSVSSLDALSTFSGNNDVIAFDFK